MAAYEKQRPEAPMNAAYYGQPIRPLQPSYYPPPPPPPPQGPPPPRPVPRLGGGPRCLLGFLVTLIVALGVATLVLRLISRPYSLKAYADSAALSRFDLGSGGSGSGGGDDLLQYNLTVDIRLRNPSRFGVRCDYAEAQAFYGGDRFGFDPLRPFYLDGRSDARVTATFGGSAVVDGDGDGARRTYQRESGEGFYYVKVKVYADLRLRVRTIVRRRGFRSKITCVLRLPVPAAGGGVNSTAMTTLGTRCDVDF